MAEARSRLDRGATSGGASSSRADAAIGRLPRAGRIVRSGVASATITLDHEARHRRRLRMTTDQGEPFLLDLSDAVRLREGDRLVLDDGRLIEVRAAAEPVADLSCGSPVLLSRVAWHIGNRHAPAQVLDGALRIRRDHVLVEMARGLGAEVVEHEAPFEPEPGAYHDH